MPLHGHISSREKPEPSASAADPVTIWGRVGIAQGSSFRIPPSPGAEPGGCGGPGVQGLLNTRSGLSLLPGLFFGVCQDVYFHFKCLANADVLEMEEPQLVHKNCTWYTNEMSSALLSPSSLLPLSDYLKT